MLVQQNQQLERLVSYIKTCRKKGLSKVKIINALKSAGWKDQDIEPAFEHIVSVKDEPAARQVKPGEKLFLAHEIMDPKVVTIDKSDKIMNVIVLLNREDAGYVMVVENQRPLGIVTGSDIVRLINQQGTINQSLSVEDIMTSPIVKSDINEKIMDVISRMRINNVERIPVVDKSKLVGVITASDIIKFLSYT